MKCFEMIEEHDPPKEPPSKVAERKWTNADITKRLNENLNVGVNRFENKFKQEIRKMMEGYVANNRNNYIAWLDTRKRRLLREKLRRLKLAQQGQAMEEVSK